MVQFLFYISWEQRKAETLFISYVEKGFPALPVLSATQDKGMVYRDDAGKIVVHDKNNEIGYKRVQPGQFVIHLRSFQGGFAHSNILGITSPAYTIFGFKEGEKQYDLFWKCVFSSPNFIKRLESVTYGIRDGRSISYDEFLTMKFIIPEYKEQVKIATCLIRTDNLITLHQCEYFLCSYKNVYLHLQQSINKITNSWEQRKLKNYFDERTERSGDGELISVTISSGIKKFSELNRHDTTPDDMSHYKVVCKGDIAYNSMRMWQGASGYSPYNGILSPAYTVIVPKNGGSSRFFAYLLKLPYMISLFCVHSQGLTKDTWNLKFPAFSEIECSAPTDIAEQDAIARTMEQLDNLITLHQRKCDKLKNIKAALLEKMFPQGDSTTPKIRFKGFTDTWEQRKLGEVTKINMGQSPAGVNYTANPNDAILVQGNADMVDGWVCPRVYTRQITKKAHVGDLIFSVRAPVGEVGKTQYDVVIGRGVAAISGNEYIFQTLKQMNAFGYWTKLSAGSTFESINSDTLKSAKLFVPKENEQRKIGEILLKIDNLITLHQRKLKDFYGGFL